MNKTEFLTLLEQRLMVLNDDERADLLSEYEQHIEMKVVSGLSEEEVIADFGDPEELIKELLDAYHLNTSYQPSGNTLTARITYSIKNSAHFISSMFDALFHYNLRDLFRLCLQVCFLIFFLSIIWFGGAFVLQLLYATVGQFWVGRVLFDVLQIFAWLAFIALTIYMMIFFIRRYILIDYTPLEPPVFTNTQYTNAAVRPDPLQLDDEWKQTFQNGKEHVLHLTEQTSDAFSRMKQKAAESRKQYAEHATQKQQKEPVSIPIPELSLRAICMKVIIWCCKCIAFFILIGAGLTALFLIAASAAMLVFLVTGYPMIGTFLIVLGCTLLSIVITGILIQFVFGIGGVQQ